MFPESQIEQILTNYRQRQTQIMKSSYLNQEFTQNSESQKMDLLQQQIDILIKEVFRLRTADRNYQNYIDRLIFRLDDLKFSIQNLQNQVKDLKDQLKQGAFKLKQQISSLEAFIKDHFQTCKQYFTENILPLKDQIFQHQENFVKIPLSDRLLLYKQSKRANIKQSQDEDHYQSEYKRINDYFDGSLMKNTCRQFQNTWTLYLREKLLQKSKMSIKLDIMNYFDWKKLAILSLSYNNIGDNGLEVLMTINMQNLKNLLLQGNQLRDLCNLNSLKNLQFLTLAQDYSRETVQEPQHIADNCSDLNRLTQKGSMQLISVAWKKLKFLNVNFICLSQTSKKDQYRLSQNQDAWNIFLMHKFVNFPALEQLRVGEYQISKNINSKILYSISNSPYKNKIQFSI